MKSIDPSLRNASVLLAGGSCLVPVLARIFSPYGWLHVRWAWLASMLVIPLLCFWCGMLSKCNLITNTETYSIWTRTKHNNDSPSGLSKQ